MTNKEFFVKTIQAERPVFLRVINAVPEAKADWKPHEKGRPARHVAMQLAYQPIFILGILKGSPDFSGYKDDEPMTMKEIVALAEKNWAELDKKITAVPDAEWEKGKTKLEFPGGKWETEKYDMAWDFLFDGIHHRGQLTTYLRAMGEKVPSVYGGSADERPTVV